MNQHQIQLNLMVMYFYNEIMIKHNFNVMNQQNKLIQFLLYNMQIQIYLYALYINELHIL